MNKQVFVWAVTFLTTSFLFLFSSQSIYAWATINGVAVCTAVSDQQVPHITSDGANGAILSWYDYRNTTSNSNAGTDIYVQRIDSNGNQVWQNNGVAICTALNYQLDNQIISDGSGGAIITWDDYRNNADYDIYVQRVDSNGSTLWTNNGVAVCTAGQNQTQPCIATDGAGGAIMSWNDFRDGTDYHIYAQRVNSAGSTVWTTNGVAICTVAGEEYFPRITSDSAGGAIIVWEDGRNSSGNDDVYAQHVNSTGSTLWADNGIAVCDQINSQYSPVITSDSAGGAIIAWDDYRNAGDGEDVYAQRVNSAGSTLWVSEGVAICTTANDKLYITLDGDGANGAVMTWQDYRLDGLTTHIFAQRVNSNGSTLWDTNGVAICTVANSQYYPQIAGDGTGGGIITWYDYRNEDTTGDIYAQRVNSTGSTLWTLNGVAICTAINNQQDPVIVSIGTEGAIIAWDDNRGADYDIYAQQVNPNGLVPVEDWWNY